MSVEGAFEIARVLKAEEVLDSCVRELVLEGLIRLRVREVQRDRERRPVAHRADRVARGGHPHPVL